MLTHYFQLRSRSIVSFNKYESDGRFIRTARQRISAEKLTTVKTYTGCLCPGAKKRLTKALENLIQFAKPKDLIRENGHRIKFSVNFITLTIHNYGVFVPGKEAHKNLLEPFVLWLRRKHHVGMYLWKAELQSERQDVAQLHYHLTTDTYIPWEEIRNKWNELQQKAGYLENYFQRFGHYNPNSTDVHALYKKRDPVSYIKKEIMNYSDCVMQKIDSAVETAMELADNPYYFGDVVNEVTKEIQNRYTIGGKVWDCSENLKDAALPEIPVTWEGDEVNVNLQREVQKGHVTKIETPHCEIYKFRRGYTWQILPRQQRKEYFKKADDLLNYRRPPKIPPAPDVPDVLSEKSTFKVASFYADQTLFSRW